MVKSAISLNEILNLNTNKKIINMENKKFTMALYSGSLDKLTAAGVILSGAAAV